MAKNEKLKLFNSLVKTAVSEMGGLNKRKVRIMILNEDEIIACSNTVTFDNLVDVAEGNSKIKTIEITDGKVYYD